MGSHNGGRSFFRRLQKFKPDYSASTFTHYESERTGMRAVVIDQKGPKVYGYFVLATEIHDDSGSPHTLEHLCFMGSRNFRYKGFLDKLATRLYSDTNAWTATDHTAYTLDTAGWEGFSLILPIYLEHIIAPTLTDAGCYTEVYHIDGTGHDAGVVYSEMQGVQNRCSELIDLRCRRLLYPEGVGFRYETGGMMEQLRVLTAERIRAFHKEMYQPKNLCLIIVGEVDHTDLLSVLDKFEDTILDVIPSPNAPFQRPWVESTPTPPLQASVIDTVEFPEEDESFGEIEIRFLGPDCNDRVQSAALNVALLYLAGSSAALLENVLVEKEHVATAVYYMTDERPRTEIRFTLTSVATESLHDVERRFFEVLRGAMQEQIDMKYMRECIQRHRRNWKFATENSASSFADYVVNSFLFGDKNGSRLLDVATLQEYEELESWHDNQWRGFIKQYMADAPHISVLGVPSAKLAAKLKADEEARIEERKRKLGEKGLKELADKLSKAKAENDKPIPREILAKIQVPDTDSIHFVHTTTAKSGHALKGGRPNNKIQQLIDLDGMDSPMFIHFEDINSNFVQFSLVISTQGVPVELLPLLSVYTETFFSLPIDRNGERVSFEQVIVDLERDTVGYTMDGSPGNSEMLAITFQIELEKYETAISYLKELTWNSIFDPERLIAVTTRLFSDVPDAKRSGSGMVGGVRYMVQYAPESIVRARSTLVRAKYLKRISKLLAKDPESVVQRMELIRKALFQPENLRILVIGDLERLPNPVSSWKPYIEGLDMSKPLLPLVKQSERLSDAGKAPGQLTYIVPMPTIDTSHVNASAKGLNCYDHPKLPALMVAIAYMNAVEGPLWVAVRGTGLAYGASFRHNVETGLIHFNIYRSPNGFKAFEAAKKIVDDHLSGVAALDPMMSLEGAISTIVAGFANEQATYILSAQESYIRQVIRNLPPDYKEALLKKVRAVTIDQLKESLREMVFPVFTPGSSDIVVTCAPVLEERIKTGFESLGFKPEVQPLKYFEDDYGLQLDDDEEDEDEDEDDEDGGLDSDTGSEEDEE
ncbi:hypothetical protein CPC735_019020 [Coccidioides posadasii C735 delta SOWgp]|uniref:Presequence protease, mitochondrial n=1 Tax=Coccidioides posadasii (strain C735) TaxID=222929 RepID=C5PDY7_COCP7|nr:hypothetical protein CPC735_019020 [Coccidioides posadasii C735 delta SOWgp]EER25298.1 hypothetical protein CPC735_019020 [Coccidioides posadasii C735 delta SOWgp]|eukprot:XP_003067443.1 hypothetical protein CPC735_019020 [Coccidioides posadasii C735 delta SOWgp]